MLGLYRTISEQVADKLRTKIFNREFQENEVLREQELIDMFKVSRGTIRHVLLNLAKEGLLTSIPNVGMKIAPYPSKDALKIIIEMRLGLECRVIDFVWELLRNEEIDEWKSLLSKMEKAAIECDAQSYRNADIAFHRFFINLYPDKHIIALWDHLLSRMQMSRFDTSKLKANIDDHEKIVRFVENNNKEEALLLLGGICINHEPVDLTND